MVCLKEYCTDAICKLSFFFLTERRFTEETVNHSIITSVLDVEFFLFTQTNQVVSCIL